DLELRAAAFQHPLKARLHDEVLITAGRQQLAARELELLLPRRALGRALAARHGKRENRRHSKYRLQCSCSHYIASLVSDMNRDGSPSQLHPRCEHHHHSLATGAM